MKKLDTNGALRPHDADVAELPRHPLHLLLAVEHARHALRRPDRLRLRRSVRASACSATRAPSTVAEVWTRRRPPPTLRADLNAGGSRFCGDCPLKLPLKKDEAPPVRAARRRAAARRGCTSSARPPATSRAPRRAARRKPASRARARPACSTSICSRASSTRPGRRSAASTSSTTARRSCTSARSRCASTSRRSFPHIYLYTSTNGLAFTEEQARRLVHSGIDEVTFSIDGATQESYVQYRQRGNFDVAIAQPARDGRREARSRARRAVPQLALHPVQLERQRRGDGRGAAAGGRDRRRSPVLGDHRSSRGRVLAALRAGHAGLRARSATRSGTTTTSATPFPARRRGREIDVPHAGARRCRCRARAGQPLTRPHARAQPVDAAVSARRPRYGRRLVRLGAQLCDARRHAHQPRLRARVAARRPRAGRRRPTSPIEIAAPADAGALRAEVRSGQRRHRLVREVRLADDDARRRRPLA